MPPKGSKLKPSMAPNSAADPSRELPLAYTTFTVPPPLNAKNIASTYLRTDSQTWVARLQAQQQAQGPLFNRGVKRRKPPTGPLASTAEGTPVVDAQGSEYEDDETQESGPPSSSTIVIHPCSTHLRIGLSSDIYPLTMPQMVARRPRQGAPPFSAREREEEGTGDGDAVMKDASPESSSSPSSRTGSPFADLSNKIEVIRSDLKNIMRNLKLRPVTNAKQQASNYNASVKPEVVPEHNDVFAVEWINAQSKELDDVVVGEKARRMDCFSQGTPSNQTPSKAMNGNGKESSRDWKLFQPMRQGRLDTDAYIEAYGPSAAKQALLNDLKAIWTHAIATPREDPNARQEPGKIVEHGLGIPTRDWSFYNVILVIPDLYSMSDIEDLTRLLLDEMGFAAILLQQEGVCATFGAGISSGCVIHIGSDRTSVTCVDEGLVVSESRLALHYSGADISRFFIDLLQRANLPYKGLDMEKRLADAWLADELKERLCTLDPMQLGLVINDVHVRLPEQPTKKYALRTYDEIILAPMCLFSPRVIDFERKRSKWSQKGVGNQAAIVPTPDPLADDDDGTEDRGIPVTTAMNLCIRHLLPAVPTPAPAPVPVSDASKEAATSSSKQATPAPNASPMPNPGEANGQAAGLLKPDEAATALTSRAGTPSAVDGAATPAVLAGEGDASSARQSPTLASKGTPTKTGQQQQQQLLPASFSIDAAWEAGKVPLDFAVWHSILGSISNMTSSSVAEERVKRLTANIICTGGTGLLPGLGMALEARMGAYVTQWYTLQLGKDAANAPNATVIPPPRDMDPRVLAWKGMSVLARLESAQELWVPRHDWSVFGTRAIREKSLFL